MKTVLLALQTVRELILKVTLLVLAGISTLILVFVLAGIGTETTDAGTSLVFFGQQKSPPLTEENLQTFVRAFEASSAGGLFAGIVLFGILATAGVMPDTLEKGTADIYFSKPLRRGEILAGRTLGAGVAIFLNILYFLGGVWLILGLKVGVWDTRFLLVPIGMTLVFLALYAIVVFLGVLSRNTAIAIIGAFLFQFVLVPLLKNREVVLYPLSSSGAYRTFLDALYYVFPQSSGLQDAVIQFVAGQPAEWGSLVAALLSAAGWYAASWWILDRTDF
jgi:ABC-type transport system involved in multi-copper enzyme maturation permease subunit